MRGWLMLRGKVRSITLAGGIILGLAAVAVPSSSSASTAVRPVPAAVREICAAGHFSCRGHWAYIGGRKDYVLSTPFAITGRGKIQPLATGCYPGNSDFCTSTNVGGGKCWSDDSQAGNGVKIVLNNCDPDSTGQVWELAGGVDGVGLSWVSGNGYCMNDPSGTNANGTQEQIWNCYATTYEDYGYAEVGPDGSQLLLAVDGENPSSSSDACLSDNGNASSGAPLLIESCNGSSNQRWVYP
jgi:hypothetical protein